MIWFVALVAWPAPLAPKCSTTLPIAARMGFARSKAAGVPPAMMASVPFCAPSTPPLTGASTNSTPREARNASAHRAVSALTVEQSMTSAPRFRPGARLSIVERTSASADTQITTVSRRAAKSARFAGAGQPSSDASDCALAVVRFQTAASMPALWRFFAMGEPMAPSPAKPTRCIGARL